MNTRFARARAATEETLYNQLYMMCQTFDQVNMPDQEAEAIDTMKDYFVAAKALNQALGTGFGEERQLLTGEDINQLEDLFTGYETAFRTGMPTDALKERMQAAVEAIRAALLERYDEEDLIAA